MYFVDCFFKFDNYILRIDHAVNCIAQGVEFLPYSTPRIQPYELRMRSSGRLDTSIEKEGSHSRAHHAEQAEFALCDHVNGELVPPTSLLASIPIPLWSYSQSPK